MIKLICKSRTYQHSVAANRWNADDQINYRHAVARRLPAEVLYDAIHRATGSVSRLPGLPPGRGRRSCSTRAVDAPGGFLDLFGKPPRESACECERIGGVQLGPVLNLVNGPVVGEAIKDPNNRIAELLQQGEGHAEDRRDAVPGRSCRACRPNRRSSRGLAAIEDGEAGLRRPDRRGEEEAPTRWRPTRRPSRADIPGWEAGFVAPAEWTPLELVGMKAKSGATLTKQPDGSILVGGKPGADGRLHRHRHDEAEPA